jgi:D-glycero-D-manno-heptose 1,7-bisphosphate phosphatase
LNDINKCPAVFLDRDGVIIVEKEFQVDPRTIEFIDGSINGLKNLDNDYILAVVSNQSGVARGYFSGDDVITFNLALNAQLGAAGITISGWYFCPHSPEDGCPCRKPQPGMFLRAEKELNIDLGQSWMIGDKTSDIAAGKYIGARTILVETGYGGKEKNALLIEPDFIAANLQEGVGIIKALGRIQKV